MVENNRPPNHRTISTIPTKGLVRYPDDLPVIGSLARDAVSLGRHVPTRRKVRLDNDQHILIFGPNGKGKGTGVLMPNSCRYQAPRSSSSIRKASWPPSLRPIGASWGAW